jgi:ankyrin repeat protein
MRAARNAEPEVVKSLVDAGADLDVQNEEGMTALMFAADEDNVENARVLVLAGANVNLKDKDGESAWDKTGDADLEALLESYGAVTDEHTPEPEPQP